MDANEFLKIQERLTAFRPNPAIIELGKMLQKTRNASDSFLKPTIATELGSLGKIMGPFIMNMKNYEGMSRVMVQFKDIHEAIKKNSAFLEYNIDLFNPQSKIIEPEEIQVKLNETKKLKRIITDIYKDHKNL